MQNGQKFWQQPLNDSIFEQFHLKIVLHWSYTYVYEVSSEGTSHFQHFLLIFFKKERFLLEYLVEKTKNNFPNWQRPSEFSIACIFSRFYFVRHLQYSALLQLVSGPWERCVYFAKFTLTSVGEKSLRRSRKGSKHLFSSSILTPFSVNIFWLACISRSKQNGTLTPPDTRRCLKTSLGAKLKPSRPSRPRAWKSLRFTKGNICLTSALRSGRPRCVCFS